DRREQKTAGNAVRTRSDDTGSRRRRLQAGAHQPGPGRRCVRPRPFCPLRRLNGVTMLGIQSTDSEQPAPPRASAGRKANVSARIVGRSAFEADLSHRFEALDAESNDPAFTVLLLRLRRSDRRIKLLATEGADEVLREVLQRVAGVLHEDDRVTAC